MGAPKRSIRDSWRLVARRPMYARGRARVKPKPLHLVVCNVLRSQHLVETLVPAVHAQRASAARSSTVLPSLSNAAARLPTAAGGLSTVCRRRAYRIEHSFCSVCQGAVERKSPHKRESPCFCLLDDLAFGRLIRLARIRRGLRQEDLGHRAGISRSVVSRVERGHLRETSLETIRDVAGALDLRVELQVRARAVDIDRVLNERHAALEDHVLDSISGLRSEEHTSELQSLRHLVCRLLLEKKK